VVHLADMVVADSGVEVSEGDSVVDLHRRVVAGISPIRNCTPTIMVLINRVPMEEVRDIVLVVVAEPAGAAAAVVTTAAAMLKVNQVNKSWFATYVLLNFV